MLSPWVVAAAGIFPSWQSRRDYILDISRGPLARFISQAGPVAVAAAFALYLTSPSFASPLLPLSWALLLAGIALSPFQRPSWPILAGMGVILASAWIAVPVSFITTSSNPTATLLLAILTTMLAPLAWLTRPEPVLKWLIPVWLIQAGVSLWEAATDAVDRADGVAANANAGAAFLLLGCIVVVNGNS